jgi:hypothetical protein
VINAGGLPLITNPCKILPNDTEILTRETSESSPFNQSRIEQIPYPGFAQPMLLAAEIAWPSQASINDFQKWCGF